MTFNRYISEDFGVKARPQRLNNFQKSLQDKFGTDSISAVENVFAQLLLPAPSGIAEYYHGRTGVLVFLERFGTVIRIEFKDGTLPPTTRGSPDINPVVERIDDNDLIAKPLARIELHSCTVELCPGFKRGATWKDAQELKDNLRADGIDCYDAQPENIGISPITGKIMLIDRLSVTRLTENISNVKKALEKAPSPEDQAYRPLEKALNAAWPDKAQKADVEKMKDFWKLCQNFVTDKKMTASWNTHPWIGGISKNYENKLRDQDIAHMPSLVRYIIGTVRLFTR